MIRSVVASTARDAEEAAQKIGFPVVMKIVSPDILHKFDFGGVLLNIKNKTEVRAAYKTIIQNVKKRKQSHPSQKYNEE